MSEPRWSDWHVVHIKEESDDDRVVDVLHPEDCGITVSIGAQGPGIVLIERHCWVAFQMQNGYPNLGYFDLSEAAPGWYRIRGRTIVHPSGPWGAAEADDEQEVSAMQWVRTDGTEQVEVERGDESGF